MWGGGGVGKLYRTNKVFSPGEFGTFPRGIPCVTQEAERFGTSEASQSCDFLFAMVEGWGGGGEGCWGERGDILYCTNEGFSPGKFGTFPRGISCVTQHAEQFGTT